MGVLGKGIQLLSAGLGFFVGYIWVVSRWAGGGGAELQVLLRFSLGAGVMVSLLYMVLLGGLFWVQVPVPRLRGLRMVISPAAFSLSCVLGAVGMQGALWVLRCS